MTYDDYVDNLKDSADAAEERQEYLESLPAELAALRAELAAERSKAAGLVPYAETVQPYERQMADLRAELAAAKERGDGLYLGLRQTLEALGGVAQPGVSEAFLILGVPGEAAAIKRVNTALALTPPAGGEAGKDSARLDHLIDRKLLSCDVFEDAAEMCIKAGCEDPDNDRRWVRAAIDRSEEEGRC